MDITERSPKVIYREMQEHCARVHDIPRTFWLFVDNIQLDRLKPIGFQENQKTIRYIRNLYREPLLHQVSRIPTLRAAYFENLCIFWYITIHIINPITVKTLARALHIGVHIRLNTLIIRCDCLNILPRHLHLSPILPDMHVDLQFYAKVWVDVFHGFDEHIRNLFGLLTRALDEDGVVDLQKLHTS